MTGSVGDRNMNQARMILLALAAAAAGLAGCSPAPDASNAPPASYEAQPAHDAHESQDPHESHDASLVAPPEGQLWPTDEPLRASMTRIETALEQAQGAGQSIGREQADLLARTVEDNVAFIVKNCKLPAEPDAALHVLIGRMLAAANELKGERAGEAAVSQLAAVLQDYRNSFDHAAAIAP